MSEQRHIINKQVLEIQMPAGADVHRISEDLSQICREKLIPVIGDLCDRYSSPGTLTRIDSLTVDLGTFRLEEMKEVFAEKLAEALEKETSSEPVTANPVPQDETPASRPLALLAYYLQTGILPWWAPGKGKIVMDEVLADLNAAPSTEYKTLLREVGRNKSFRERFVATFSEDGVHKTLSLLSGDSLSGVLELRKQLEKALSDKSTTNSSRQRIIHAYWSAVFARLSVMSNSPELPRQALRQGLDALALEGDSHLRFLLTSVGGTSTDSASDVYSEKIKDVQGEIEKMRQKHTDNPLLQTFVKQLSMVLEHPLLASLPSSEMEKLRRLLTELATALNQEEIIDPRAMDTLTRIHLVPLAQYLQNTEKKLEQMEAHPRKAVMAQLHSAYDETEFVTVPNAGLVLLWPFLPRFFEKNNLLEDKDFRNEPERNKAIGLLQSLTGEIDKDFFEGDLALNKILCGGDLSVPVLPETISPEEKETGEGLLQAVIARGPYWKNLSTEGFRNSYLCREGLLRARDGHWLLQVKRETFDITLEKLPWGFGTVKLPWMNEILIVEWI